MTLIGFEAEFETNAADMVRWLYERQETLGIDNLIATNILHRYHCECRECDIDAYLLRGQNDSTCSGELVSGVMDLDTDAELFVDLTKAIEQAAIAVDAHPGVNSGVHVHVDAPESRNTQIVAFGEWLRWEHVLRSQIATGRFGLVRNMNRYIRDNMIGSIEHYLRNYMDQTGARIDPYGGLTTLCRLDDEIRNGIYSELLDLNFHQDRHSTLCTNTTHNTWEFRIWNSTRSAWRLELACRVSRLWTDREFLDELREVDYRFLEYATSEALHALVDAADNRDSRAAELLARQIAFKAAAPQGVREPFLIT